jgi:formylglycine-generating enzyme required for sulfatase activity
VDHPAVTRDILALDGAPHAEAELTSGSRTSPAGATRARASRIARQVKILFFAANADKHHMLAIGNEHDAIEASIRASRYRDHFQLIARLSGRLSDLHQALLDHDPDIVHFACHGTDRAELLLMQDGGGAAPVPAAALSQTFRVLRDSLVLVVFNACFSSAQAAAIRDNVKLAIGMNRPIEDPAAIAFAAELYRALASGRSVRDAFDLGVAAIRASSSSDPGPHISAATRTAARRMRFAPGRFLAVSPRRLLLAGSVGLVLAATLRFLRHDPELSSPPPSGMVRFSAAGVRMGVFATDQRPEQCRALAASEDCALEHAEGVGETRVEAFDLDRTEVTNADYAAWLNANVDLWNVPNEYGIVRTQREPTIALIRTKKCGDGLTIALEGRAHVTAESARRPAVCVTWHGADEYCRAMDKRLPLEAEWELAAKGAEARPFSWGRDMPRHDGVAFDLRDGAEVHPREVGGSPQDVSPDGVYDLAGNVAEWVEDGRDDLEQKTARGGSFASRGPCHLLGSGCQRVAGDSYHKDVGFRCARSVIDRSRDGR